MAEIITRGINKNGDLYVIKSEGLSLTLTASQDDGTALDISSYTNIELKVDQTDGTNIFTASLTGSYLSFVNTGTDGRFQIDVPSSITSVLTEDSGEFTLEVTTGGGKTTRWVKGKAILQD